MLRWRVFVIMGFVALGLSSRLARAQTCPNPQTGPLVGTSGEWCLTQQDQSTVNWGLPVTMSTTIGPVTSVSTSASRTVCRATWECWSWQPCPCAAAAQAPPPGGGGASGCGFTAGRLSGCGAIVLLEYCLSLSQPGQQLLQQRAAACPLPPMPAPVAGCPPAQSMTATCPCPTGGTIPPCTRIRVPVTANVQSNVNYNDCTDSANWTDLQGTPQQAVSHHPVEVRGGVRGRALPVRHDAG